MPFYFDPFVVNYFVAVIFFVVGLHLLGVIPMPGNGPGNVGMKRKGLLVAFVFGLIFGIALGPCIFAYMGSHARRYVQARC